MLNSSQHNSRDADAMLKAGKEPAEILQTLEIAESTYDRRLKQYGGMKSEQAKRLKELEDKNKRLKRLVPTGRPCTS